VSKEKRILGDLRRPKRSKLWYASVYQTYVSTDGNDDDRMRRKMMVLRKIMKSN
jgi:hypothetical protein